MIGKSRGQQLAEERKRGRIPQDVEGFQDSRAQEGAQMEVRPDRVEQLNQPARRPLIRIKTGSLGRGTLEGVMGAGGQIPGKNRPTRGWVKLGKAQKSEISAGERRLLIGDDSSQTRHPV